VNGSLKLEIPEYGTLSLSTDGAMTPYIHIVSSETDVRCPLSLEHAAIIRDWLTSALVCQEDAKIQAANAAAWRAWADQSMEQGYNPYNLPPEPIQARPKGTMQ